MKKLIYLLLCFAFTTTVAQEETTTPQIAIRIPLGETAVTDGISIKFVEVTEDSRCPTDVVCVWAGQAKVKVILTGSPVLNHEFEVTVGKKGDNIVSVLDGFVIKAVALTPYPTQKNIGKRDYALLVAKEKV